MCIWEYSLCVSGHVVVDVCAIQSADVYVNTSLDTLGDTEINSKSRRYVLPLNIGGKVYTCISLTASCVVLVNRN